MKNVYHLINDSDISRGGAQRILHKIKSYQESLGYNVSIIELNQSASASVIRKLINVFKSFFLIIRVESNSFIFCHSKFLAFSSVLLKFFGCKVIFVAHSQNNSVFNILKFFPFDRTIAVSYSVSNSYGFKNCMVIYNPINVLNDNEFNTLVDLNHFCYVGALEPWKGIDTIMSVFLRPDLGIKKLSIVGNGSLDREINYFISKASILKIEIKNYGFKPFPYGIIGDCAVQLVPSYHEGFGMVLLEAILARKLVICRDIDVFREVSRDIVGVIFFQDEEQLYSILKSNLELSYTLSQEFYDVNRGILLNRFSDAEFYSMHLNVLRELS